MQRREVALALGSLAVMPSLMASKPKARGPLFWVAKRGNARVFLLGISAAKDRSWFTPTIQAAFEQSSTLWEEVAPPPSPEYINQLYDQYGSDTQRTLFDALDPPVRESAERYMVELSMDRKSIEHMRPWRAYLRVQLTRGQCQLSQIVKDSCFAMCSKSASVVRSTSSCRIHS